MKKIVFKIPFISSFLLDIFVIRLDNLLGVPNELSECLLIFDLFIIVEFPLRDSRDILVISLD